MDTDHGKIIPVETMAISKFKATCLAVLEQVRRTGEPVLVTKRGEPIAEVVPASRAAPGQRSLGLLAGTARIRGDVVAPAADESDWEALRG